MQRGQFGSQNVRRELRQRAAEKLKELHRVAKQQARAGKGAGADDASGGNPMSIMDDTYGEPERSGAAADAADATAAVADGEAGNAEAIARVEKKVRDCRLRFDAYDGCARVRSMMPMLVAGGLAYGANGLYGEILQRSCWSG